MKPLYLIGGPMGVGKTAAGKALAALLSGSVFLDGDWCWQPEVVTPETKAMVLDNICHLLGNYLRCSAYRQVIFTWVMHRQAIVAEILSRLPPCRPCPVSLVCSEAELVRGLQGDIAAGVRDASVVPRSLARLPLYQTMDTVKLDVTTLTPAETAGAICRLFPL